MELEELITQIVSDDQTHARFLNTLSLQENIGARKISANELPETSTYMVLKHAAEEHRHAFYLKKQIGKLSSSACPTYEPDYLLAPYSSKYYLNKLDMATSRYLMEHLQLKGSTLKFAAYLLVTYAIEVRADLLYPVYQDILTRTGSKVSVRSIILEEQGHLEEMTAQLKNFSPDWELHANNIISIEEKLYKNWIGDLAIAIQQEARYIQ
jgi:rubrerythrin